MVQLVLWAGVSPAHAGMDRLWTFLGQHVGGFPRTRGDGPQHDYRADRGQWFPPHTRGWTPSPPMQEKAVRVSPAHAGWTGRAVPYAVRDEVSPAHAGMDRRGLTNHRKCTQLGFPRTRGDGPLVAAVNVRAGIDGFPPHTRGWTAATMLIDFFVHQVSPAHAGMDLAALRRA